MRLAILGTDRKLLQLLAAAAAAGHEIVWLGDVRPEDEPILGQLVPNLPPAESWELLLDQATADAVLVGRGAASDDLRAEQLKRLATDAVPMLVTQPIVDSVLTYYEVDMLRRETRGVVHHFNPLAGHPQLAEFARWVREGDSPVGPIHQVSCERPVENATRKAVLDSLACDVELLSSIAGNIGHVSAVGPRSTDATYASLQIQMTSPSATTLRWSITPARHDRVDSDVTLLGERGTVQLLIPHTEVGRAPQPWQLLTAVDGERRSHDLETFDAPEVAIARLARALDEQDAEHRAAYSQWDKAVQAMEIVDAVELSLQKGRTIEVHQQQLTEKLAFRGTMAALGCGLLLVGFLVVVAAAMLGGIESLVRQPLMRPWPVILLAVLAFFLLLQTVPMLASKPRRNSSSSSNDAASSD